MTKYFTKFHFSFYPNLRDLQVLPFSQRGVSADRQTLSVDKQKRALGLFDSTKVHTCNGAEDLKEISKLSKIFKISKYLEQDLCLQ